MTTLVAVVIADPRGYERSLVARPIEAPAAAFLWEALGAAVVPESLAGPAASSAGG